MDIPNVSHVVVPLTLEFTICPVTDNLLTTAHALDAVHSPEVCWRIAACDKLLAFIAI